VAEVWRALDAKVWQPGPGWAGAVDRWVRARWLRALERAPSGEKAAVPAIVPGSLGLRWFAWRQAREEAVQAHLRRATVEQDLEWQQRTGRSLVQGL
jgi:hypothetical protein